MAKLERTFYHNDFDRLLEKIEERIINGSVSASMEDQSDFEAGGSRCSVRVFERYSWSGGNRLSMSVTLFQAGEEITAGGSQAVFWKLNTIGEESFLEKLEEILEDEL